MREFFRDLIEAEKIYFRGWITPFSSPVSHVAKGFVAQKRNYYFLALGLALLLSISFHFINSFLQFRDLVFQSWNVDPTRPRSLTYIFSYSESIEIGLGVLFPFILVSLFRIGQIRLSHWKNLRSEIKPSPVSYLTILGIISRNSALLFLIIWFTLRINFAHYLYLYFSYDWGTFTYELQQIYTRWGVAAFLWIGLCLPLLVDRVAHTPHKFWAAFLGIMSVLILICLIHIQTYGLIRTISLPRWYLIWFHELGLLIFSILPIPIHCLYSMKMYRSS